MFRLLKLKRFIPGRIVNVLFTASFESGVWTQPANIWEQSAQNNSLYVLCELNFNSWGSSHNVISPHFTVSRATVIQHRPFLLIRKNFQNLSFCEWNETRPCFHELRPKATFLVDVMFVTLVYVSSFMSSNWHVVCLTFLLFCRENAIP